VGPAAQHPVAGTITGSVDPPTNAGSVVEAADVVDVSGTVVVVDAATELTGVVDEPHPTTPHPNANSTIGDSKDRRALRETRPLLTTTSTLPITRSASVLSMNPECAQNNYQLALELNRCALGDPWSHGLGPHAIMLWMGVVGSPSVDVLERGHDCEVEVGGTVSADIGAALVRHDVSNRCWQRVEGLFDEHDLLGGGLRFPAE
jgi:hypothetical protein